jgi:hypothetical protein
MAALFCLALLLGFSLCQPAAAEEHERDAQGRPSVGRPERGPRGGEAGGRPAFARPGAPGGARPTFDGHGQILDQRYNHGRYYPPNGAVFNALPSGYRPYYRGRDRFYFSGGIWYSPRGPGFVVIQPPPGLVISVLPPYYSTVWFGGNPYYYADNVYYTWQPEQNGYVIVDPPANSDQPSTAPENAASPADDLIIYPKNGQSKDQQAADQFECHGWAKNQTGFDPTQPGGGVQSGDIDRIRSNYNRAMSACLQGRGYQVN